MTTLVWHGRLYSVLAMPEGEFSVLADAHQETVKDKAAAARWLSSHSLRKGKARQLVADEDAKNV